MRSKVFIPLVMLVMLSTRVEAFFIPSAIQLLSASLSNIIAYIAIIAGVFFISAFGFIKTKMMNKRFILGTLGIMAIVLTSYLIHSELSVIREYNIADRSIEHPSLFNRAFAMEDGQNTEVAINFTFFDDYNSESPMAEEVFNYSGKDLNQSLFEPYLMRLLDHSLASEKICVEGEANGINIETCSRNCVEEIGVGNCFDIYVLYIFDLMSGGEYSTGIDMNSLGLEDISNYKLFSHIPQQVISRFTEMRLEGRLFMTSLEDIDTFNNSLAEYSDDKIIFICYWGHSSNVLASVARSLGYDAYSAAFNDIENNELIDIRELEQANVDNAVLINQYSRRNRLRDSVYITIDGLIDDSRYGSDTDVVKGIFENGRLVFPDLDTSEIHKKNIVCSSRLGCSLVQYWLSSEDLTEEVNQIYMY